MIIMKRDFSNWRQKRQERDLPPDELLHIMTEIWGKQIADEKMNEFKKWKEEQEDENNA